MVDITRIFTDDNPGVWVLTDVDGRWDEFSTVVKAIEAALRLYDDIEFERLEVKLCKVYPFSVRRPAPEILIGTKVVSFD
jgi:hypothetical protein